MKNTIKKIVTAILEICGVKVKYHWYNVKFVYKVNYQEVFNFQDQVGFINQSDILNHRKVKKALPPFHKYKAMKRRLSNGVMICEDFAYLGYFSKNSK